jgi:membrane protease YdiL (CAAX protease family)
MIKLNWDLALKIIIILLLTNYFPFGWISPHVPWFRSLDELTGFPPLAERIISCAIMLAVYGWFSIQLEQKSFKQSFFIYNPLPGLARGFLLGVLMLVVTLCLFYASGLVGFHGWASSWGHIGALFGAWLIAQIFNSIKEEVIYRAYFLKHLADKIDPRLAVFVTAMVFGLGHIAQYGFIGYLFATFFGVLLGYAYLCYKNIYVNIALHAIWDIGSHTLLTGRVIAFSLGPHSNDADLRYNICIGLSILIMMVCIGAHSKKFSSKKT